MSREIRCRVYSKRLKVYIDYYTVGFSKSGELQYLSYGHGAGPVFAGEYIVEQDTGLKDKNGKRICEGDIVKKYDDGDIAPIIGVVEFCKSGARFGVNGGRHLLSQRWEVVGNIHENSELLEN